MDDIRTLLNALAEGVAQMQQRVEGLEAENRHLQAQRESLERQVMDMANEPVEQMWKKVIFLYADDDLPDPAA